MKKILSIIALSLALLSFGLVVNNVYANTTATTGTTGGGTITVEVTESIPGAGCTEHTATDASGAIRKDSKGNEMIIYKCNIKKGFGQITIMLGQIIKYFTFLAGLGGVLFIVINGILYSMGGIDSGGKDEAKKRIVKTLIGLTILLLSGVILNIVAPWIYTF